MKKFRKGFTLVELLIVIAVLGALSASMAVSVKGSTAKAKASAIASNVEACKSAALQYYAANMEDSNTLNTATTSAVIRTYVKTWDDFNRTSDTKAIKYVPDDAATGTGIDKWNITVNFNGDGEAAAIREALAKIPGYGTYDNTGGNSAEDKLAGNTFQVFLFSGEVKKVGNDS